MDTFIYYSKKCNFKLFFCVQKKAKICSVKDNVLIFQYEGHMTIKTPQNVFWSWSKVVRAIKRAKRNIFTCSIVCQSLGMKIKIYIFGRLHDTRFSHSLVKRANFLVVRAHFRASHFHQHHSRVKLHILIDSSIRVSSYFFELMPTYSRWSLWYTNLNLWVIWALNWGNL